jgi:hypothetical protein
MPLSAFATNKVLDALMRGQPLIMPSVYYLALVTTAGPTNALGGVEVTGGAYQRVPVPASLSFWAGTQGDGSTGVSIGTSGTTSNNGAITFPTPSDNWGQVVGYEFWDALTFGNRWFFGALAVPKTVSAGDPAVNFPISELHLSVL